MKYMTMNGVAVEDIPAQLQSVFTEPGAYKGVPGGADLTDINTGFMLERVTQVFGIKGWGWNFTFKPEDIELMGEGNRVTARLRYAEFSYCLMNEAGEREWVVIPTGGMNTNKMEYVEEGARTSALGAALKGLTFQLPIYKGKFDHHDADKANAEVTRAEARINSGATANKAPAANAKAPAQAPAKTNGATNPAPSAEVAQPVAQAPVAEDAELAKAYTTIIPAGVPLAGKTLGDAVNDQVFGVFVVKFLAGEIANRANQWYKPQTEEDREVVRYAKLLVSQMVPAN